MPYGAGVSASDPGLATGSAGSGSGISGIKSTTDPSTSTSTAASDPKFVWTDGWYVALACGAGVLTANTRIGPLVFGVLSIALIYQTSLLLQGK